VAASKSCQQWVTKKHANFPLDSKLTYLTLVLLYHIADRADPNVVSYNTAISACADGEGEWEHAIQLLKQMQQCQVEPDCWRVAMRGDLAWGIALYIQNASRHWFSEVHGFRW